MKSLFRIKTAVMSCALAGLAMMNIAQAQTTKLTLSSWVPPTHYVTTEILEPWMAAVKKATDGRVTISILPKPVGSPAQHWELARKGVADITWGNFTYEPERFKQIWFSELPMMGISSEASSVALWRTYEKYLAQNDAFKGVVMLAVGRQGGGQFHHPSKLIVTPEDLKGQKVRMGGPIQKRVLEELGAIPVSGPGTKAYELLEGGVIDASLHANESIVNFRLEDKLKYHSIVPGGLYDATFFIIINERKFKTLSAADQETILKLSGEMLSKQWGHVFDIQNSKAEATLRASGHQFGQPNQDLLDAISKVRSTMLVELQAEGPSFGVNDVGAMVDFYQQQFQSLSK